MHSRFKNKLISQKRSKFYLGENHNPQLSPNTDKMLFLAGSGWPFGVGEGGEGVGGRGILKSTIIKLCLKQGYDSSGGDAGGQEDKLVMKQDLILIL